MKFFDLKFDVMDGCSVEILNSSILTYEFS